ncbi:hypothetical protein J3R30DRAFT_91437 [Lentinula aciculospora]|uniref:Uncharacterized protein n=1 Tax=Lentinula aciculospora TaxID=153920 RepID=A0A9W9AUB1_9AGAR|nr:hypothetical protein J3R30DRAFT_91437 [Lentinula aciculospora]
MTASRFLLCSLKQKNYRQGSFIRLVQIIRSRSHQCRMASTNSSTTQKVAIPYINEFYDPNFLDILLPPSTDDVLMDIDTPTPKNAMMDALQATAHLTFTENGAPAFSSTLSPIVDAFSGLNSFSDARKLDLLLSRSWKEDSSLTLRLIWQLRSIHDGKSQKEGFYRAFGWLYKNHPRTAIANLRMLVEPVCQNKKRPELPFSHGYWKDLLNILALATTHELDAMNATFLHHPRAPYTYTRDQAKEKLTPEAHEHHLAEVKARAKANRVRIGEERYEFLKRRLENPSYRALYVMVARLFVEQLIKDLQVAHELQHLPHNQDRIPLLKKISLAAKWAPSPAASHDRVTNISSAIALLLHHSRSRLSQPFPSALSTFDSAQFSANPELAVDQYMILRSYLGRWVLAPLRSLLLLPEPLMCSNRWSEIRYNRVASVSMKNNTEHFFKHDPDRFQQYLMDVETGKKTVSGATLLPHQIVVEVAKINAKIHSESSKYPKLQAFRKEHGEMRIRVLEAQWKSLVERLRESGALENSLAICDVSGSMGVLAGSTSRNPSPIAPAISLSLLLAQLARPPFNQGFITFSATPQFVTLDPSLGLAQTINTMENAEWGMNTDLNAVFLNLLLPLAVKNIVPKEEMIKQLFVFSDMQFDHARHGPYHDYGAKPKNSNRWKTNYDHVVDAYAKAGYDMPRIVYWNLAGFGTSEVTAEKEGVALMNGYSPSMLKVFMGEEDESDGEWEKISKTKEADSESFNPVNIMKRSVMKSSFDGLVVMD